MAQTPGIERRLAAILAADVAGYSRLMGEDPEATVEAITACREIFSGRVAQQGGRVVNAPGDSILAEFASVVNAVQCSVDIQRALAVRNAPLPVERRMEFRIGVNLGDVIVKEDAIYGDGVNIAARLEGLAEAGGICVSRTVHDNVKGRLPAEFEYLGEHQVKNIAEPVRAYRVVPDGDAQAAADKSQRSPETPKAEAEPAGPPVVAVLPFDNLSNDPDQEYFADGITEELITILAQFRHLAVIARNSTFTYKGRAVDVRTVGKEMGAEFVLEGSVRRSKDRVRVTVQLLSSSDGTHLWADTYNTDLSVADLFALQDEIAQKVAAAVGGVYGIISLSKSREASRKPPERLRSYDCVLKYFEFLRNFTSSSHASTRDCLERTVEDDPAYADGWALLGGSYLCEYAFGFNERPEPLERAEAAIRKSLTLDPSSPNAQVEELRLQYYCKDSRFVENALSWAESNPNDSFRLLSLGTWLCWAGQWEHGLRLLEQSARYNPVLPGWGYFPRADWHFKNRDYERALELVLKSEMRGFYQYNLRLARAYAGLGRMDEATEQAAIVRQLRPDFEQNAYTVLRIIYWDEDFVEACIELYRKAGLNIPYETEKR